MGSKTPLLFLSSKLSPPPAFPVLVNDVTLLLVSEGGDRGVTALDASRCVQSLLCWWQPGRPTQACSSLASSTRHCSSCFLTVFPKDGNHAILSLQSKIQIPNFGIKVNCNWPQAAFPPLTSCQLPHLLCWECPCSPLCLSILLGSLKGHFHEYVPKLHLLVPSYSKLTSSQSWHLCCIIFLCSEYIHVCSSLGATPQKLWAACYSLSCSLKCHVSASIGQPGQPQIPSEGHFSLGY